MCATDLDLIDGSIHPVCATDNYEILPCQELVRMWNLAPFQWYLSFHLFASTIASYTPRLSRVLSCGAKFYQLHIARARLLFNTSSLAVRSSTFVIRILIA